MVPRIELVCGRCQGVIRWPKSTE